MKSTDPNFIQAIKDGEKFMKEHPNVPVIDVNTGERRLAKDWQHEDSLTPSAALTIANSAGLSIDYFGGIDAFREIAGRIVKAWGRYTQPPAQSGKESQ